MATKPDLKLQMPLTALWIDCRRKEFGVAHVNACIREAMAGKPGRFYAIENGHIAGMAFPATSEIAEFQTLAIATGCKFAAFIATPEVAP